MKTTFPPPLPRTFSTPFHFSTDKSSHTLAVSRSGRFIASSFERLSFDKLGYQVSVIDSTTMTEIAQLIDCEESSSSSSSPPPSSRHRQREFRNTIDHHAAAASATTQPMTRRRLNVVYPCVLSWSPDETLLAIGMSDGEFFVVQPSTNRFLLRQSTSRSGVVDITALAWCPSHFAPQRQRSDAGSECSAFAALSGGSCFLLSGNSQGQLTAWNTQDWGRVHDSLALVAGREDKPDYAPRITQLVFHPNHPLFVVGNTSGETFQVFTFSAEEKDAIRLMRKSQQEQQKQYRTVGSSSPTDLFSLGAQSGYPPSVVVTITKLAAFPKDANLPTDALFLPDNNDILLCNWNHGGGGWVKQLTSVDMTAGRPCGQFPIPVWKSLLSHNMTTLFACSEFVVVHHPCSAYDGHNESAVSVVLLENSSNQQQQQQQWKGNVLPLNHVKDLNKSRENSVVAFVGGNAAAGGGGEDEDEKDKSPASEPGDAPIVARAAVLDGGRRILAHVRTPRGDSLVLVDF